MKRNIDEVKKEVEGLRDGTGKPIDELIKPLVIGLRMWGFQTQNSCQGHFKCLLGYLRKIWYRIRRVYLSWESYECLPWAQIVIKDPAEAIRLKKILAEWQGNWILVDLHTEDNIWLLRPKGRWWELRKKQREALNLGLFLQQLPTDF